jgi:hypothetical protein
MIDEIDNVMDAIRVVLEETLDVPELNVPDAYLEAVCNKIKIGLEPEIENRIEKIEQLSGEIDSFEDSISELEGENNSLIKDAEDLEEAQEAISLAAMFRRAGCYCHDVTHGEKPLF